MDTWISGCVKKHVGCGGLVRFVENLCQTQYEKNACHAEWLFECTECGEMLFEEQVEFSGGSSTETKNIDQPTNLSMKYEVLGHDIDEIWDESDAPDPEVD